MYFPLFKASFTGLLASDSRLLTPDLGGVLRLVQHP